MKLMIFFTLNSKSFVFESCLDSPFTNVWIRRLPASPTSFGGHHHRSERRILIEAFTEAPLRHSAGILNTPYSQRLFLKQVGLVRTTAKMNFRSNVCLWKDSRNYPWLYTSRANLLQDRAATCVTRRHWRKHSLPRNPKTSSSLMFLPVLPMTMLS